MQAWYVYERSRIVFHENNSFPKYTASKINILNENLKYICGSIYNFTKAS